MPPAPPATLAEMIAPLPVAAFRDLLRRRKPHLEQQAGDFTGLIGWDRLVDPALVDNCPPRHFGIYRHAQRVPQIFFWERGAYKPEAIDQIMAGSASILVTGIDKLVAPVGDLCRAVAAELDENVGATVIATTDGGKGAFDLHCDAYDLVVLQVEGTKHWKVYDDPMPDPVLGIPRRLDRDTPPMLIETDLGPGDWMFVPAGYWHHCDMHAERSLHIAIKIYPLTAPRVLDLLMREMSDRPEDRAPIRFDDRATAEAALKQQLIDRIAATPLDELIRRHAATDVLD